MLKPHLCIIGAGAAGLSIAAGAAQLGIDVVLIEADKMGGDCLNSGCVPSKSIIAAAKAASFYKKTKPFGVSYLAPEMDFGQVHTYIHSVIKAIAPHDSVERYESLGVKVILGTAKFINKKTLEVNGQKICAKYFILTTGAKAFVPPINGLSEVNYYTNENIFNLNEQPEHLVVLGAGAIGCEIAQAYAKLGVKVTLLEVNKVVPTGDRPQVNLLKQELIKSGVELHEGIDITEVIKTKDDKVAINYLLNETANTVIGSHLFVATGRRPNVKSLQLDAAGIKYTARGVQVNSRLRTSNKRVFAAGDIIGQAQFTHMSSYYAGIIIKNILFKLRAKISDKIVPWVVYTNPELAQVGITEDYAKQNNIKHTVLEHEFAENDRAQTDNVKLGKIKVIISKKSKVLGVSILGESAGELLMPWVLAMENNLSIASIAQSIVPYPTLSEVSKRAAGKYYSPMLFSKKTKLVVKILSMLP